jgi:hypothetical protein
MTADQGRYPAEYAVHFAVEYPDRPLDRLTSFFRIFMIIPILIVLGTITGETSQSKGSNSVMIHAPGIMIHGGVATGGLLFLGPLLMILFRQKYPRWWFDWNLELQRFANRVGTYLALMNDSYPSTDDHQWVELDYAYPDVSADLNRWLPLVKWLLAIPHYVAGRCWQAVAAAVAVTIAVSGSSPVEATLPAYGRERPKSSGKLTYSRLLGVLAGWHGGRL